MVLWRGKGYLGRQVVRGQGYGSFALPHSPPPSPPVQCDPNLQVYNVFIDNLDERLPRIALFATRHIRAGEELTFDYNMQGECPPGGPEGGPGPTAWESPGVGSSP